MSNFENISEEPQLPLGYYEQPELQFLQMQQQYGAENRWDDMGNYFEEDVYRPSPQIVPDTQTGFDMSGDYHVQQQEQVPDVAGRDPYTTVQPYRWASWLNDAITQYCSTFDYTVGRVERWDIAQDLVNEKIEENGLTPEEGQEYLHYWQRIYGRGVQGDE